MRLGQLWGDHGATLPYPLEDRHLLGTSGNGQGTLTLSNLTITNGFAVDGAGGGVYNGDGSNLVVTNSTISNNVATRGGGGIFNAGTLVVLSSTFFQNDTNSNLPYSGGGISSASGSSLTVSNSTIFANTTDTDGGGISSETADARVWNTTIVGNTSVTGGAGISAGEFASSTSRCGTPSWPSTVTRVLRAFLPI